jgi:hypothetical protein
LKAARRWARSGPKVWAKTGYWYLHNVCLESRTTHNYHTRMFLFTFNKIEGGRPGCCRPSSIFQARPSRRSNCGGPSPGSDNTRWSSESARLGISGPSPGIQRFPTSQFNGRRSETAAASPSAESWGLASPNGRVTAGTRTAAVRAADGPGLKDGTRTAAAGPAAFNFVECE